MSVQRYNRAGDDVIGMFPGMMKHPKGRWVLFDSHQSSLAEREQRIAELTEQRDRLSREVNDLRYELRECQRIGSGT